MTDSNELFRTVIDRWFAMFKGFMKEIDAQEPITPEDIAAVAARRSTLLTRLFLATGFIESCATIGAPSHTAARWRVGIQSVLELINDLEKSYHKVTSERLMLVLMELENMWLAPKFKRSVTLNWEAYMKHGLRDIDGLR